MSFHYSKIYINYKKCDFAITRSELLQLNELVFLETPF